MSRYRVGVDIGGTFTDFAAYDTETGRVFGLKVPTVPHDPVEGVWNGLDALRADSGVEPNEIGYFVHGTTIAVNTLIERKGARLALLVTKGFRDLLIIQRLRIPNPQNWFGGRPAPLIRRARVYEIDERLRADGSVHTPISEEALERALEQARAEGVVGLVVCFLHAFRNPVHEKAARDYLERRAPELHVCCSHEVWPRMREYERAIVSIINAYVAPRVAGYLGELEERLADLGVPAVPYITRSNGGVMTARSARRVPGDMLLSGPAAGVVGAVQVAERAGIRDFITLDVGGTSADVAIVEGGRPQMSQSEHVADFPIMMPVVGVSSIGAGGGSVAWVDDAGVLKVGPESVGSDPGPACYGRGNERPTLTDAFLVGGLVTPQTFAAGRHPLSLELAEQAIETLATGLDKSPAEAADAVLSVAVAASYAELSNLAAQRGVGLRDFSLVAFGGAGPLLACRVANEAGIDRILVPPTPGTLCAVGALCADVAGNVVQSVVGTLADCLPVLPELYSELEQQAREWLAEEAPFLDEHRVALSADMRYVGQSFEIAVELEPSWVLEDNAGAIAAAFHEAHRRVFAHADPTAPVEIIDLRLQISGNTPKPPSTLLPPEGASEASQSTTQRRVFIEGRYRDVPVYLRDELAAHQHIEGPAIVDQSDTTVFIAPGWSARVHESASLILQRQSP